MGTLPATVPAAVISEPSPETWRRVHAVENVADYAPPITGHRLMRFPAGAASDLQLRFAGSLLKRVQGMVVGRGFRLRLLVGLHIALGTIG